MPTTEPTWYALQQSLITAGDRVTDTNHSRDGVVRWVSGFIVLIYHIEFDDRPGRLETRFGSAIRKIGATQ